MENWKVEMMAGGQILAEVKIHWGISLEDSLLTLIFVIVMMPFNHVLSGSNQFSKSQENIYHLKCMDDIKVFEKKMKKNRKPW